MYKEKLVGEVEMTLRRAGQILAEHFNAEDKTTVAALIVAARLAEGASPLNDNFGRSTTVVQYIFDGLSDAAGMGYNPAEKIITDLVASYMEQQSAQNLSTLLQQDVPSEEREDFEP